MHVNLCVCLCEYILFCVHVCVFVYFCVCDFVASVCVVRLGKFDVV